MAFTARQLRSIPCRNRFRVSLMPSGPSTMVYGSPSMSISRRTGAVSLVVTLSRELRSKGPGTQHVIHAPFTLLLPNGGVSEHLGGNEHVVCGLQYPLQVRRITL